MQNYRRLLFLVCIITVSIAASLGADVVRRFADMSKSLDISIARLGNERLDVRQEAAADIKEINASDDQILLAWARFSLLFNRIEGLEDHHTDYWLRVTDEVFSLVDLDKTPPGLLAAFKDGSAGDSALNLDTLIIQLGNENPQVRQDAAAAIKDMNLPDDQLLLAWVKVSRLLSEWWMTITQFTMRDEVLRLIDLDEALGGLLPLLKSVNNDETILARFVIGEIEHKLYGAEITPLAGTALLLAESLKDPNAEIRATACRLLGVMPAHAEAAVPGLIVALNDENQDVQTAAVAASGKIAVAIPAVHPEIVKTLIALTHDSRYVQLAAVGALGNIARAVPKVQLEIAERFIQLLNTPNFVISPFGEEPHGSRGLHRRDFSYSNFHVQVAGNLDLIGDAAVPLLVEAMNATDPGVRHHAAIALAGMGSEHDEAAIPILIEALASPYRVTREVAINNFVELAKQPALVNKVLHALVRLLESTDDTVENRVARPEAVWALGRLIASSIYNPKEGSRTPIVNPEKKLEIAEKLIAALNTRNFETGLFGRGSKPPSRHDVSNFHVAVARCLWSIGDAAVPLLAEAMDAPDAGVRHHAALALARIGSEHDEATIPIVIEALASPYLHTRDEAVSALNRLAAQAPLADDEITSIFVNVLETTSYMDARLYGSTYHGFVASVAYALPLSAAIELLQSENAYVQEIVATTIARVTIGKPEMVDSETKRRVVEILAVSTIKEIGNRELIAETKQYIDQKQQGAEQND